MRLTDFVATLALVTMLVGPPTAVAQLAPAPPTIHNVRLHELSGELTITGTGFGAEPLVAVDGQPVTVLPGGTDTQLVVLAPAAALTTPGTYRLTVVDPARQAGDGFVIAVTADTVTAVVASGSAGPGGASSSRTSRDSVTGPDASAPGRAAAGTTGASPNLVEDPSNTAVGYAALPNLTSGFGNTAAGTSALFLNTTGTDNTGAGDRALYWNTFGSWNTALGKFALHNNTASGNTATGFAALYFNTAGADNVATGYEALNANTGGARNTATGHTALRANGLGSDNVAVGYQSNAYNPFGRWNVSVGSQSLHASQSEGNTALGHFALGAHADFGGFNTVVGYRAGGQLDGGTGNIYIGANVSGVGVEQLTTRIGVGQNQTFISGIWGNQLTGTAAQVFVDANGKLGTGTPVAILTAGSATPLMPAALELQQPMPDRLDALERLVNDQRATIAAQDAALVAVRERLAALEGAKARRR